MKYAVREPDHVEYDRHAAKRAANLSINADLLAQARQQDINLSATLEQALVKLLQQKRREQWLAENSSAIDAYNEDVAVSGVFSDGLRRF